MNKNYTQTEIREAHKRVSKDLENAHSTYKGVALAIECQTMVLSHLTSIMEEEKKPEEEKKEDSEEEQAKE